jgi:hypothetical protein
MNPFNEPGTSQESKNSTNDSPVLTEAEVAQANEAGRRSQEAGTIANEKWEEFRDADEAGTPDSSADRQQVEPDVDPTTKP